MFLVSVNFMNALSVSITFFFTVCLHGKTSLKLYCMYTVYKRKCNIMHPTALHFQQ